VCGVGGGGQWSAGCRGGASARDEGVQVAREEGSEGGKG
jgi:hypothetical protein